MGANKTASLLAAALHGEDSAREGLLERLRPRIVLWVASRLSDSLRARIEPDDVAQEVLLAMHKGLDRFEGRGLRAFLGWTFTLAENRIRDIAKHHRALKRQLPEPRERPQTTPSSMASRAEQMARVRRALRRVSEPHREVLRLRLLEERPHEEIAERLGRTSGATRVLYCRALAALREELEDA